MRSDKHKIGFTLVELLVVIGIISLAMAIVLPSMLQVFKASADTQARAIVTANLAAARSLALRDLVFTLVHFQMGVDGRCWLAVMKRNNPESSDEKFRVAAAWPPQALPPDMAVGQLDLKFTDGTNFLANIGNDAALDDFTCFDVIFAPNGRVSVNELSPSFDTTERTVFLDSNPPPLTEEEKKRLMWNPAVFNGADEKGVRAFVILNYPQFRGMNASQRKQWLTDTGLALGVNVNTGQMVVSGR